MRKNQIHLLKQWDEPIQNLPDIAAGIIYKGIYDLLADGVDTVTDGLNEAKAEAVTQLRDASTPDAQSTWMHYISSLDKAQKLWSMTIMPYYIAEAQKKSKNKVSD